MMLQKKYVLVCLFNFLVAALMGLALRYVFVQPLPFNFRFLTHAHSHVAMLGWVYLMLYLLLVHYFVPIKKTVYRRLFWVTQGAVLGMMLSFPIQGYAAVSISFSTLHILCSYYFVRLVWKHHRVDAMAARYLLKASLVFMLLSTIGVWCLGPAVGLMGQVSAFYQIAIQFFLHFQFNGWFLFAVLAVFLQQFNLDKPLLFRRFFWLQVAATILTLALPVSWFAPHPVLLWINGASVLLQILALYHGVKLVRPHWTAFLSTKAPLVQRLYKFAMACLLLKIGLQTLSLFPQIAEMAFQFRNFVIGFIHLTMLGVVSGFLMAFIVQSPLANAARSGISLGIHGFMAGFLTTELLLFIQGCLFYTGAGMLPNYYLLLLLCSVLLPLGILCLILNIFYHDHKTLKTT